MQCDRIARPYRWFEYIAFGRALERCRFRYLPAVQHCSNALLLGDGDGRFLCELAAANPAIQLDSVDSSLGMLREARQRAQRRGIANPRRIQLAHSDAFRYSLPPNRYDLVVANFFFDCFSTISVEELVKRILPACRAKAFWVISEFQQPAAGWRAWHARVWLTTMYCFFGLTTGLATRRLPNYAKVLEGAGLQLLSKTTSRTGLISAELWRTD
ncbi:MAG TPA: class I SAM-dependent methyltransferase [Bryobacteraceae bacterium]|jgi:ubiquinone/menaquinone biosynthesis C-methylase UbiE|nr:class I SAM-dependent methyltransferase [Bryobacteraceae bacterium]